MRQSEGNSISEKRNSLCEAPEARGKARGLMWLGVVRVGWGGCPSCPVREKRSAWTSGVAVGQGEVNGFRRELRV